MVQVANMNVSKQNGSYVMLDHEAEFSNNQKLEDFVTIWIRYKLTRFRQYQKSNHVVMYIDVTKHFCQNLIQDKIWLTINYLILIYLQEEHTNVLRN